MDKQPPRVAVLGPVTVTTEDGTAVEPAGATARALLTALALGADASRSIHALTAEVWDEEHAPGNPRGAVQTLVSRLRAAAGVGLVRSDVAGYALGEGVSSDLALARDLERRATALAEADPARLTLLDEAVALWHGEPGADLGGAPIAEVLAEDAAALRDRLDTARARTLIALGRPTDAVHTLRGQADAHPYDEDVHMLLMTALADAGRTQEALAVHAGLRARLRDDLGSSPGAASAALNARILRGETAPAHAPMRIGLRAAPNDLIGRDDDLEQIADLLTRSRLVTILGPGGLGKTRLAQAAAAASASRLVAVVALAGVRADDDLEPAIGAALGISEARTSGTLADARAQPDLHARIAAFLGERPALLVLDNCEQIIDAVAAWTADLLASLPSLRILTTSRTPVSIAAETVYPLAALATSASDEPGPAVRLFLERAAAVRPGAALTPEVVVRLCDRLDGLPLAIELAAARVRTMTAEQIESRLANRFALLTSADRAAPQRHRTLQAVIEWSWDLLDHDSRRALARLSILPGGFSATTAAAVLGEDDVDDLLDRLVGQSLLVVADAPHGGIRFRMLETVREFGLARLDDGATADAWSAVLTWAAGWTRMPGAALFGPCAPVRADVLRDLQAENDNLVAALRHALDTDQAAAAVLVFAALTPSWVVRGAFTELAGFAPAMLTAIERMPDDAVPADALAPVLLVCALAALVGDDARGLRVFGRIRRLRRDAEGLSPAWCALLAVAADVARPDRLVARLAELRESPEASVRLVAEFMTAQYAENAGDPVLAEAASHRAWELAERIGDRWLSSLAASSAAQVASQSARPEETLAWLDRARHGFDDFGALDELRQQDWTRGMSLLSLGRLDEAERLFDALTLVTDLTAQGLEFASVGWFGLAEIARSRGDLELAVTRYERSIATFRSPDQRASPWFLLALASFVAASALDDLPIAETTAFWSDRLRIRVIATRRLRPQVDHPVLGTTLAGWSAWAVTVPESRATALEALAFAEALGCRQDLPSLHLDVLRAHAEAHAGADAVAGARAAARTLTDDELVRRAFGVFEAPRTD
ncbi:putative ATPase/DNA-binding SARP family transcriptional activator [Microbacterium sp. ZKA21]|uniref:ATP-binding protein n=1 Tax=Microbacterium sp. ZKA21 TaxID=3381694 RepID=UPI003D230BFE